MTCYRLSNTTDMQAFLKRLDVSKEGLAQLLPKTSLNLIYIKDLRTPAANILKQDALSIGADVAVPKDAITCKDTHVDAVLIANDKQLKHLCLKEKAQPFGLKALAQKLSTLSMTSNDDFTIMGVLNANDDSFYKASRFSHDDALVRIKRMIEEGVHIIDVGGVSSRPGSVGISEEEELMRLKPIIDVISTEKLHEQVVFSLDSYSPLCLEYALQRGFGIVNDITALSDDRVAKVAAHYQATVVLMHMQGTPKQMQQRPHYEDIIDELDVFFEERIAKAKAYGIEKLILDVGIGFGKSLEHNLLLLKHHAHFLHFGYPLLVGASRKSMIDTIYQSAIEERLAGTLALHIKAYENGASILRVHDVKEHVQALSVVQALNKIF
ncbi:MAG: dihydropteroate synthase [Sulfurospirillaceae bacterium]|nr:dihydropteroate synthase [Sulfurospirillaceae bacterium]